MAGRIELKFLVDWRQRAIILDRWRAYLVQAPFTDERGIYPIMSLYFDTPSLDFYYEKLEGEMLRNKVRLRGYGYLWPDLSPVFLEIKRKVDDRVIKYRRHYENFAAHLLEPPTWNLEIGDIESDETSGSGAKRARNERDLTQLALLFERFRLRPAVQILYQREAYESEHFPSLRIAFDSQLLALHPKEVTERWMFEDPHRRLLDERLFIFEVKSDGDLPGWVISGLHAAGVTQRALSKYCFGIEKLQLHDREIGVYA